MKALEHMFERLEDSQKTPSARILKAMNDESESYYSFSMRMAQQQAKYYRERQPSEATLTKYQHMAAQSLQLQQQIEISDQMSFEHYLADYYCQ